MPPDPVSGEDPTTKAAILVVSPTLVIPELLVNGKSLTLPKFTTEDPSLYMMSAVVGIAVPCASVALRTILLDVAYWILTVAAPLAVVTVIPFPDNTLEIAPCPSNSTQAEFTSS